MTVYRIKFLPLVLYNDIFIYKRFSCFLDNFELLLRAAMRLRLIQVLVHSNAFSILSVFILAMVLRFGIFINRFMS